MKKRILVSAITGAVVIAVTLIIFFVAVDNPTSVQKAALAFLLAAEILTPSVLIGLELFKNNESVMLRAGSLSALALYFFATVVISLVFLFAAESMKVLVIINTMICGLFVITMVLTFAASHTVGQNNRKTLETVSKVQILETRAVSMKNNPAYKDFAPQLNKIYEAAKYCDCASATPTDALIQVRLDDLERVLSSGNEDKAQKATELCDTILMLFKQRAGEAKSLKRGGI